MLLLGWVGGRSSGQREDVLWREGDVLWRKSQVRVSVIECMLVPPSRVPALWEGREGGVAEAGSGQGLEGGSLLPARRGGFSCGA